jgi:hypothetical protein
MIEINNENNINNNIDNNIDNNILDFKTALEALNQVSESFTTEAWVPSKQIFLTFKEIDAKQQKHLLSVAMDNSIYNSQFTKCFYNILKDNLLQEDKNILDELNLADKASIAISLKNQISKELNVVFEEKEKIVEKVSLQNIIEKFKKYNSPQAKSVDIKNENYEIKVQLLLPNIKTELEYDEQLKKMKKKVDQIKTNEDIQEIVSDAFIGETSKYIQKIWLNDTEIDMSNIQPDQKIKMVEKIPSGLIQKILEQISEWKKEIDEILTVKHQEYTKVISIDSLLFLS